MEIYRRNQAVCPPADEFFVQRKEIQTASGAFFPQISAGDFFKSTPQLASAAMQALKALFCFFLMAICATEAFNIHIPKRLQNDWIAQDMMSSSRPSETGNFYDNYYIEWRPYVVCSGDTLWDIAKSCTGNGLAYHLIAEENQLGNPDLIFPGDIIYIPFYHLIDEP